MRRRAQHQDESDRQASLDAMASRIEDIAAAVGQLGERQEELMAAIRHAGEDEPGVRRQLRRAREEPDYEVAWTEDDPLVTVCIPTYTRWRTLVERAIPSVFAQDHGNVEIIVVGDAVGPEVEQAIDDLGDPRVRFENLTIRGPYPEDRVGLWHVAGTGPLNRAMEMARGRWIAVLNDDDALRPDHVSTLLEVARTNHVEVAYGSILQHQPDETTIRHGNFPPAEQRFGWQASLQHAAMRLFEYELVAAVFGEPGDWHRVRRMMRAGVRFAHVDTVLVDYWPGTLWPEG